MVLLVGAGLLMRSFLNIRTVDLGFQTENVLTMQVRPSWALYDGRPDPAFYSLLYERIATLPGVVESGATSRLPMRGRFGGWQVRSEERAAADREQEYESGVKLVGGSYFRTMGIALLKGRDGGEQDRSDAPHVVVINDLLARLRWPAGDPIGRRIAAGRLSLEVVGVVGNVKDSLDGEAAPLFYVPYRQFLGGDIQPTRLVVRTADNPFAMIDAIHREAAELDPGMIINDIATMDQIKGGYITPQRFSHAVTQHIRRRCRCTGRGRHLRCDVLFGAPTNPRDRRSQGAGGAGGRPAVDGRSPGHEAGRDRLGGRPGHHRRGHPGYSEICFGKSRRPTL